MVSTYCFGFAESDLCTYGSTTLPEKLPHMSLRNHGQSKQTCASNWVSKNPKTFFSQPVTWPDMLALSRSHYPVRCNFALPNLRAPKPTLFWDKLTCANHLRDAGRRDAGRRDAGRWMASCVVSLPPSKQRKTVRVFVQELSIPCLKLWTLKIETAIPFMPQSVVDTYNQCTKIKLRGGCDTIYFGCVQMR